jgi:putative endonuclease
VDGRDERGHDGGEDVASHADALGKDSPAVMAGLVPAIHVWLQWRMPYFRRRRMGAWVYIMTNRRNGTLYIGVTSNLPRRVWEHREGVVDGFTKEYGLKVLVWYDHFDRISDAIQREKTMKHWPRAWKVRLIHAMNPDWEDLFGTLI